MTQDPLPTVPDVNDDPRPADAAPSVRWTRRRIIMASVAAVAALSLIVGGIAIALNRGETEAEPVSNGGDSIEPTATPEPGETPVDGPVLVIAPQAPFDVDCAGLLARMSVAGLTAAPMEGVAPDVDDTASAQGGLMKCTFSGGLTSVYLELLGNASDIYAPEAQLAGDLTSIDVAGDRSQSICRNVSWGTYCTGDVLVGETWANIYYMRTGVASADPLGDLLGETDAILVDVASALSGVVAGPAWEPAERALDAGRVCGADAVSLAAHFGVAGTRGAGAGLMYEPRATEIAARERSGLVECSVEGDGTSIFFDALSSGGWNFVLPSSGLTDEDVVIPGADRVTTYGGAGDHVWGATVVYRGSVIGVTMPHAPSDPVAALTAFVADLGD